jgi:hypothetical protein
LGLGISCACYILFIGIVASFGWGIKWVEIISSLYIGFKPSILGAIIGAIWGFVDGAIGGAIIALVYNGFVGKNKTE